MNILFIIDPLLSLHVETDTTLLIMREAHNRGHTVSSATLDDLFIDGAVPYGTATELIFAHKTGHIELPQCMTSVLHKLNDFDVIFMRKDPPCDMAYVNATHILSLVDRTKTFVLNEPSALRNFNEKCGIFEFPTCIPPTLVGRRSSELMGIIKTHKKVVLKPLDGFGGSEIIVVEAGDKNTDVFLEMLTRHGTRYIMAQKYLSEIKDGDIRVLILDGKILGQQKRLPHDASHRANISAGGSSHSVHLTPRQEEVSVQIGMELKKRGIYFAGLDFIGDYITEINITSPTGIAKINAHDNVHLEKDVVDFLESYA